MRFAPFLCVFFFAACQSAPPKATLDAPPQATAASQILASLPGQVSAQNIERDIVKLVGFGTRNTLSDTISETRGIGAARRWIKAEFERISADCGGCLEVMEISGMVGPQRRIPAPTEIVNIIAIQRGIIDPDRYVMMSGDIDSRVTDATDAISDSPGANDNASGVAGVLEAARVLSKHRFAGSIIYAALSGEEQGLLGGAIIGDYALAQGWRIKAVLNNDMIGNTGGMDGKTHDKIARVFSEGTRFVETEQEARQRRFAGGEVDSPSRNLARFIDRQADRYLPDLDVMMVYRLDRFSRGGHHRPFNERGIPGVRIMEVAENYTRQHQNLRVENGIAYGDVVEGVNFDYAAKLTALNIVSLAEMAMAPPFPIDVRIEGAVRPSTTLRWTRPGGEKAANLAGFRVYWRLTDEPQWHEARDVGDVDHVTLEHIIIDNYFFGVSAVAHNGAETPVVFPGATGSFGQ